MQKRTVHLDVHVHVHEYVRIKPEDKVFTTYLVRAHSKLNCKTTTQKLLLQYLGDFKMHQVASFVTFINERNSQESMDARHTTHQCTMNIPGTSIL